MKSSGRLATKSLLHGGLAASLILSSVAHAQVAGDFRISANGSVSTIASWQTFNGTSWVTATALPGSTTTIRPPSVANIASTFSSGTPNVAWGDMLVGAANGWTINSTVSNSSLTVNSFSKASQQMFFSGAGFTLNITGAATNAGNTSFGTVSAALKEVNIGGKLTVGSLFMNTQTANFAEVDVAAGTLNLLNSSALSGSTTVNAAGLSGSGTVRVRQALTANQTLTAALALDSGSDFTSSASIFDFTTAATGANVSASLSKAGIGTQTLTGALQYKGATTVTDGKLLINGTGVLNANGSDGTAAAAVEVNGGTFGGSGTVNRAINVTTDLQAGSGTFDTLKVGANLNFASDSTITLALGALGTEHSTLQRNSGTWVFDITQTFNLIDLGITATELTPTVYTNVITGLNAPAGSLTALWNVDPASGYAGVFTVNGNNVDLSLTAIPEPSALIMLASGLGLLTLRRRRLS